MSSLIKRMREMFKEDELFQSLPEYVKFLELLKTEEESENVSIIYLRKWVYQKQFPVDLEKIHNAMKLVEGYTDVHYWKSMLISISIKLIFRYY